MVRRFGILLCVVLILDLVALVFAAELGVVVYQDNPGQHVPTMELIEQWATEKGVKVDITMAGHANRRTIITTALEGGTGPDIIMLADYEPHLYSEGLLDLTDLAQDIAQENGGWYPIAEEIGSVQGSWKALPIYIYMHLMMYRRDVLEKAAAEVPDSWEDFKSVLQKVKAVETEMQPFGVSYGRSFDGQQFLISRILARGGKVLSEDETSVVFESPETIAALQYVIDLYKEGLVDPTVLGWDDGTNNQAMLSGRIAFTFNGFSVKMQAEKDFPDLNPHLGVSVYPKGEVTRVCFPFTLSYAIRKNSRNLNLAKDLLRYLFRKESYEKVLNYTRGATGVSLQGFANLPIWQEDPDWRANLDAIPYAHLFAPPSAAAAEVYNSYVIVDMIADVLVRALTPEQAVAKAAKRIEEVYFGGKE